MFDDDDDAESQLRSNLIQSVRRSVELIQQMSRLDPPKVTEDVDEFLLIVRRLQARSTSVLDQLQTAVNAVHRGEEENW